MKKCKCGNEVAGHGNKKYCSDECNRKYSDTNRFKMEQQYKFLGSDFLFNLETE